MAATAPILKSRQFREAREGEWKRLEGLLDRLERNSLKSLNDEDLIALPRLYRTALSSLSTARAISLDRALTEYLEGLCTRAYFAVYGVRASPWVQAARFFAHDWPAAVRALWRETLAGLACTVFGAVAAFALVRSNADWFFAFVPRAMAQGRDPSAAAAALRAPLYDQTHNASAMLLPFATYLFGHNAQIALFAFALGFLFCVPTALLAVFNGATLGALVEIYAAKGLAGPLGGWLSIHGVTEMFATILAVAAGFRIGATVVSPGARTRLDALAQEGRRAVAVMAGVVLMLVVAGALEGVGRQLVQSDAVRWTVGWGVGLGWIVYFYGPALWGRRRAP